MTFKLKNAIESYFRDMPSTEMELNWKIPVLVLNICLILWQIYKLFHIKNKKKQ